MNPSFHSLLEKVRAIVESHQQRTDKLGAICTLLRDSVPHYDWVGFYLVDDLQAQTLVLGPFAGEPTEHVKIPFGKGICGQAAETRETFIVQDVTQESNYLSCSPRVKSEIVVPILKEGQIIGELDIDSHAFAPFSDKDRLFLEEVCELVSGLF